jgi:VanZ family protein
VAPERRRIYLVLLVGWVGLTFLLTSIPHPHLPVDVPYFDKAAHFGIYGVTGFLYALLRRETGVPRSRAILHALLFVASVGAVDEVHQHWIPGRSMDLFDWMTDVAGGALGTAASGVLPRFLPFLVTESSSGGHA